MLISTIERVEAAAKANKAQLKYFPCNVTDADDVTRTFDQITPTLRHPIRGLVACAGISDNGPAVDFSAPQFRRLFEVNVTGTFLVSQACAREMIKNNVSGSIVLVASMSGYVSNRVSYSHTCFFGI
jgi:NAD(P)-dependent dehydrogenase (short-subunit alcohol dehydrogenase family)